ncbi:MAG: hypothetical protein ACON4T_08820 [Synechococcus sp.]
MDKRIKVPADLQLLATLKSWSGELASLEGVVKTSFSGGLTKWKFVREKGGWQYLGNPLADMSFKQKEYSVIPDSSGDEVSSDALEIERSALRETVNRTASDVQDIKAILANNWNYTMLSLDNRVLKIGETRWKKEPSELKAELEKRYRQKKEREKGGPFRYVAHQAGDRDSETAAKEYLKEGGVKPLYGTEYFPSHEALVVLRKYGKWCLGEWGTDGGFLPPIQEAEQRELLE